jgi:hypothetical protein
MSETHDVGDLVTVSITVRDAAEALADPGTVTLKVKPPNQAVQTYTGGQLAHPSLGVYQRDISLTAEGVWHVRFETTGNPQIAEEADLVVRRSKVLV